MKKFEETKLLWFTDIAFASTFLPYEKSLASENFPTSITIDSKINF